MYSVPQGPLAHLGGPGHLCWEGSCRPEEEVEKPEVRDGLWGVRERDRGRAVSREEATLES